MAAARRYLEPIPGRSTPVSPERVREDPKLIDGHIDEAVIYVDVQDQEEWTDCFKINDGTYNLTVCPCLHPSIICRAMDDEAAHNRATRKQVQEMITGFKINY